ncbi:MAG: SpoIIE family protein phosphatase, partial [Planctomycetota bacterium]
PSPAPPGPPPDPAPGSIPDSTLDANPAPKLTLRAISRTDSGAPVRPFALGATGSYTIGRSSQSDWPIPDPSVSRRHAQVSQRGGTWFITDLSSRHGTTINGVSLEPNQPAPMQHNDDIAFGGWRCRCQSGSARPGMTTPFAAPPDAGASISAIDASHLTGVAQRGLEAILTLSGSLEAAEDVAGVSRALVEAIRDATGCRRVVVVRPSSDEELEVLASTAETTPRLSRSLIEQATKHGMVQLSDAGAGPNQAHSIMELNIRSAICAPVLVGGAPGAFIMLDTRDTEGVVPPDAAAFCQSVARLAGMAFERLLSAALAERHQQLQSDLEAARRAQELLSPARTGGHAGVQYVFESIPGRIVAGDLFDFFPLDHARSAFFLGDVSGKGVGAAMLMAAAQSQLRTQLLSGAGLADAVARVNTDLHGRTESSKFVTLIAGVIDPDRRTVQLVDAGHGFAIIVPAQGAPQRAASPHGFPLGVVESADYEVFEAGLEPGGRVVVFSDGAVEQPNPEGDQFGIDAVIESIGGAAASDETTAALLRDVRAHAQADLADDLTVACMQLQD